MRESNNTLEKIRAMRYDRANTTSAMEANNSSLGTNESEIKNEKNATAGTTASKKNQSGFQNEEDIKANDAGNTTDPDKSEKSPSEQASLWRAFGEFLANLLANITDLFKDFFNKNSVKVEYLLRTDDGFMHDYQEAKKKYKPSTGQEVIIYTNINHKKIFDPAQKLESFIKAAIGDLQNVMLGRELPEDNILALSADDYRTKILDILGCPNSTQYKTIGDWVKYLKTNALGKKQKVVIRPSDIPAHESIAIKSVSALRAVVSKDKNDITALTNELNRAFHAVSTNKNLPDEARNRCKRYANRAKDLLEDYKGIKEEAYNIYMQNIMQSRSVLERMYNF